jgi:hypothetical protein
MSLNLPLRSGSGISTPERIFFNLCWFEAAVATSGNPGGGEGFDDHIEFVVGIAAASAREDKFRWVTGDKKGSG